MKLFHRHRSMTAFVFSVLCVALIASTAAPQDKATRSGSLQGADVRRFDTLNPCYPDATSAACLKARADALEKRVDSLEKNLAQLTAKVDGLQAGLGAIGNPQQGKADGYDDLWSAIHALTERVKRLER